MSSRWKIMMPNDPNTIKKCQIKAHKQFLAYTYLVNSNQQKYDSLVKGLATQKSLKNNQYPKTITDATHVLSAHKFNNFKQQKGQQ